MLNSFKYYDRVPKQVSKSVTFDFPFVRPYKVTYFCIFDQKGLIFTILLENDLYLMK